MAAKLNRGGCLSTGCEIEHHITLEQAMAENETCAAKAWL